MSKRKLIYILLYILVCVPKMVFAQYSAGMTGMMNIPTAENENAGTVYLGGNFIPKDMLPAYFTKNYNSGNYFLTANIFSFFEVSYRMTLLRDTNQKYKQQDRSFSLRIQALREGKYRPGIALGMHDPMVDQGISSYEDYYLVTTKGFELKNVLHVNATLGYYLPFQSSKNAIYKVHHKGLFGGVSLSHPRLRDVELMAEYDSERLNVGVAAKFLKCVRFHMFTQEFKNVSAGLRYECELWH